MRTKKELLKEAQEYRGTTAGLTFISLLNACIEERRKRSDSAEHEQVLRNQGAIEELKWLVKHLSLTQPLEEHDGAFNE